MVFENFFSRENRLTVRRYTRDRESRRTITRQSPDCQTTVSRCFSQNSNNSKNVAEHSKICWLLRKEPILYLLSGFKSCYIYIHIPVKAVWEK